MNERGTNHPRHRNACEPGKVDAIIGCGSQPLCGLLWWLLILLMICQVPVSGLCESTSPRISFMPQWVPQAQFAGYMVAYDKGFYGNAGLDVEMRTGGPGKDCFASLSEESLTFCTGWLSTAIQKRASGERIVNLAQMLQRSGLLVVARAQSGIHTPEDLNGKRVGFWPGEFSVPGAACLRKHRLRVDVVPNYTTVTLFLKGPVDAIAAMWYNEYHMILNSGINPDELTVLRFPDMGVDFPEDGLYCREDAFLANPSMCVAFADASLKGWAYAFAHEEEALDIVMEYALRANTGTNRAHQRWMLARIKDLMLPAGEGRPMGILTRQDYERVGSELEKLSLIERLPRYDDFYKGRSADGDRNQTAGSRSR
ncbi:MAG: ABC transporter substrate-binding protein [Thermodesulfobacteriota bacterium]